MPRGPGSGIVRHAGVPIPSKGKQQIGVVLCAKRSIETQIAVIHKGLCRAVVAEPGREPSDYLDLVTFQKDGRDQGGAFMRSELTTDQKIPVWRVEMGRGRR